MLHRFFHLPGRLFLIGLLIILVLGGVACKKKTPEERFQEATQLLQEQQIPLAILKLQDLIAEYPDSEIIPDVRLTLANVWVGIGRQENVEKAIAQLQQVYSSLDLTDQRALSAHEGIVSLYMQTERFDLALEQARKGVEKSADADEALHAEMQMLLASIQLASDDETVQQEGLEFFRSLMVEGDDTAVRGQAREILAQYYRMNSKFEESNEVYEAYLAVHPDDPVKPMILMAMGINLKAIEKNEEAARVFNEGATMTLATIDEELDDQIRARKLNELALLYDRFGDVEQAEAMLRRIMSEMPMSQAAIQAQMGIGELYINNEMWDRAEELYKQVEEENPNSNLEQMARQYIQAIGEMKRRLAEMEANGETPATEPESAPTPASEEVIEEAAP